MSSKFQVPSSKLEPKGTYNRWCRKCGVNTPHQPHPRVDWLLVCTTRGCGTERPFTKFNDQPVRKERSMRRVLSLVFLCVLCVLCVESQAQQIHATLLYQETATGISKVFVDTRGSGITNHVYQCTVTGAPTTATVLVRKSDDAVTWSTETTLACATAQTYTTGTVSNFYTVDMTALSGGSSPKVTVTYDGYRPGQGLPVRQSEGGCGSTTTWTAGSILFQGASSACAQDNANIFWDDTNNRLGIGTATPSATLTIGADKWFVTSAGAMTSNGTGTIKSDAIGNVALTSMGFSGQTAAIEETKNSAGTVLASTTADGTVKGMRGGTNNVALSGTPKCDYTVTTVANTVTETVLNTYTVGAATLAANRAVRVTATGTYSTANGTDTVSLKPRVQTTAWHTITSTGASVTNAQWSLQWLVIVKTTGSSGDAESQLPFAFINSVFKSDPNTAVETIDTTATRAFDISATWSAADAGNTISIRQFCLEVLN